MRCFYFVGNYILSSLVAKNLGNYIPKSIFLVLRRAQGDHGKAPIRISIASVFDGIFILKFASIPSCFNKNTIRFGQRYSRWNLSTLKVVPFWPLTSTPTGEISVGLSYPYGLVLSGILVLLNAILNCAASFSAIFSSLLYKIRNFAPEQFTLRLLLRSSSCCTVKFLGASFPSKVRIRARSVRLSLARFSARSFAAAALSLITAITWPLILLLLTCVISSAASAAIRISPETLPPQLSHQTDRRLNDGTKSWMNSPITPIATAASDTYPALSQRDRDDIRALRSASEAMRRYSRFEDITAWVIGIGGVLLVGCLSKRWFWDDRP
jgi:hypothetical protein